MYSYIIYWFKKNSFSSHLRYAFFTIIFQLLTNFFSVIREPLPSSASPTDDEVEGDANRSHSPGRHFSSIIKLSSWRRGEKFVRGHLVCKRLLATFSHSKPKDRVVIKVRNLRVNHWNIWVQFGHCQQRIYLKCTKHKMESVN